MNFPKQPTTLYVGNVVTFQKYGETRTGIVVEETIYSHCPGANSVLVCDETGGLLRFPTCVGAFQTVSKDGNVDTARALWRASLAQYPAWTERLAAGYCAF